MKRTAATLGIEAILMRAQEHSHGLPLLSVIRICRCRHAGQGRAECRHDGQASVAQPSYRPLASASTDLSAVQTSPPEPFTPPRSLMVVDGKPTVVFSSIDPLAPGSTERQNSIYEWSHDQVFLVTAEPPGLQRLSRHAGEESYVGSLGADADSSDLYFYTPSSLNWEDGDERFSIYDARIGGGFPEPPPNPVPCNPGTEGSCQGPAGTPAAVPGSSSATFAGPENPKPKQACKKGFVRKNGKCVKSQQKKHKKQKRKKKGSKSGKKQANSGQEAGK